MESAIQLRAINCDVQKFNRLIQVDSEKYNFSMTFNTIAISSESYHNFLVYKANVAIVTDAFVAKHLLHRTFTTIFTTYLLCVDRLLPKHSSKYLLDL